MMSAPFATEVLHQESRNTFRVCLRQRIRLWSSYIAEFGPILPHLQEKVTVMGEVCCLMVHGTAPMRYWGRSAHSIDMNHSASPCLLSYSFHDRRISKRSQREWSLNRWNRFSCRSLNLRGFLVLSPRNSNSGRPTGLLLWHRDCGERKRWSVLGSMYSTSYLGETFWLTYYQLRWTWMGHHEDSDNRHASRTDRCLESGRI